MHTVIAQHLRILQCPLDTAAKFRFTARQRGNASLACLPVARRSVEQRLHQTVVAQALLEFLSAVGVREQVLDRAETIGSGCGKALKKIMLRVQHAEVGGKTRHVNSSLQKVRRMAKAAG